MNRKWIVILAVTAVLAIVAAPVVVGLWEHRSLGSAKTFADACDLLGEPVETFASVSAIDDRFGNWRHCDQGYHFYARLATRY